MVFGQSYDLHLNRFFKALKELQFDEIAVILDEMEHIASEKTHYRLWTHYFSGVVEQEKNRNWSKAEEIFANVLARNPEDDLRAHIYLSQAISLENQGRWLESIDVASKGATLWQQLDQPLRMAVLLRQMAIGYYRGFESGDFGADALARAKSICQEAIAILESETINSSDLRLYEFDRSHYTSITYQVLGCIHLCMGNYLLARQDFQKYLDISMVQDDNFHVGAASWYLAETYHYGDSVDKNGVIRLYDKALDVFQQKNESFYQLHLLAGKGMLLYRLKSFQKALKCFHESMALLESVRLGISSEDARSGFFSTVINIHDNTILAAIDTSDYPKAIEVAELARSRAFLDKMVGEIFENEEVYAPTITITKLQSHLPTNGIIFEFHCTGLLKAHGHNMTEQQAANNILYPAPKTLLFAITKDEITIHDLNLSPNALLSSNLEQSIEQLFLPEPMRKNLYKALIAPAAHLLQNKRRLYIIPHGPLHYVPFHALIAPDGDTLLREDGPEIVYAPSATILFRELPEKNEVPPGSCLTVGYNGDAGWQLRFAEEEASYIAQMANGVPLVGATSKKEALYAQAPSFQALHFSCHGEFDPESPLDSLLHIGPNETLTGQEIMDNLRLNCNLVTLSACESGLSQVQRGDELYGLIRAFMYAGAPAIIATLWRVDERSTLLFAQKFYELVQQGVPYATALKAAQLYLRNLTRAEARRALAQHWSGGDAFDELLLLADKYLKGLAHTAEPKEADAHSHTTFHGEHDNDKIFADPKYWAPFVLIGDPHIRRHEP